MELILAFVAGAAFVCLVLLGHSRWRAATSPSSHLEPPEPHSQPDAPLQASRAEEPDLAPPENQNAETHASKPRPPLERLQELAAELDAVGSASAHPADLLQNGAFLEARALLASADITLRTVIDYASGAHWMLAAAAFAALAERADREEAGSTLAARFGGLGPWPMYHALKYFAALETRPALGTLVPSGKEWWAEQPIMLTLLAEHFAERRERGDPVDFGDALVRLSRDEAQSVELLLQRIDDPAAAELLEKLRAWRATSLDRAFLESIGRFHEPEFTERLLVEHDGIAEQLAIAQACVAHQPARSVLAVAEPRTGKTSFLRLLALKMRERGWVLFEAGSASLMSGQSYFGQLEERLRRLTSELAVEKRVLWYVPDLMELASSGRHEGQLASMLDQVFPAIATGRIVMLSETTAAGLTKLLKLKPGMRSAFEILRLRALVDDEVTKLSQRVSLRMRDELGVHMDAEALDAANHLARYYLGTAQMPGALLDLMKLGAQHAAAADRSELLRDDLLLVLSQMTGMPRSVLDDRERIELAKIREFFAARVIGQPEAVAAVVDRIAMLKAGLTDPARPTAVFLFAGPTGTGKTELAKTLAEYLFGSADRLLRLDMSEYQGPDSLHRLLGGGGDATTGDSLTERIRKQPFSVVLLDEFEKAAPPVWDLFLQVFDDGRLTDASGNTADFKHAIIILTSNLGAIAHRGGRIGFSSGGSTFSSEQVYRAVTESFRPEFVNRLDKVIVFRPLTRELMRDILKKELARVLERRGLRHREWAVEWEASALDFLLERGFTPEMGARPLKRAIDQYLLAPLAATMVEHRFPEGDQFLFVRSDGQAIQVEFVDPDAPTAGAPKPAEARTGSALTLAGVMLQSSGEAEELELLGSVLESLEAKLAGDEFASLRESLAAAMSAADFWSRDERHRTLARYALLDRLESAFETARGLYGRLVRSRGASGRYSRDLLARLGGHLWVLREGITDALTNAPVEVAVGIEPAMESGGAPRQGSDWCERLAKMYRAWAESRRMQLQQESASTAFIVSGFGAARVLLMEAGLHVLEHGDGDVERTVARIRVAETPLGVEGRPSLGRMPTAASGGAAGAASIVRRYRLEPSPLVRDAPSGWRTGRADLVLGGQFDLMAEWLRAARDA